MSLSQVTMAALVQAQGGTHLAICGNLTGEERRTLKSAEIFFVVRQDDSVVRGRGTYRPGENEWGACADLTDQPLSVGKAVVMGLVVAEIAMELVVAERDNAFGFTTLTWMQDIPILSKLPADRKNPCVSEH